MRPDLDDFEELNEDGAPRSRAMSWLVLIVAVGGFAALAYYAYHSGSQSMQGGQVLVVQADGTPIKEAPVDAQGEEFPNQDKTIYDTISPSNDAKVEKLLPEPEEPVIPEPAVEEAAPAVTAPASPSPATTTYVNKELDANNTPVIDPVDAQSMKQPAPALAPESKPAAVVKKEEPSAGAPAMVNTKTVTPAAKPAEGKAAPAPAPKPAPAPTPAPKPATAPAASGDYKIQLGAFKSDAEARQQWSKISAKHGDVVKGSPIVMKADVKGVTYYRLRVSGFASADAAKAVCAKLSSRGQACMSVGK